MKPYVILDKSYLMACSKERFAKVCEAHRILMTGSLLYELVKGPAKVRAAQLSKFPESEPPYLLVPYVGTFLAHEIKSHSSCGLPSSRVPHRDYRLHQSLVNQAFSLNDRDARALAVKMAEIEVDSEQFLKDVELFRTSYLGMLSGSDETKRLKRDELEDRIANDKSFLADQYALIKIAPMLLPNSSKAPFGLMDESWATYRWLQVQNLFALDLCFRYPDSCIVSKSINGGEKLKHDVLDAQYLIVALLEGT